MQISIFFGKLICLSLSLLSCERCNTRNDGWMEKWILVEDIEVGVGSVNKIEVLQLEKQRS